MAPPTEATIRELLPPAVEAQLAALDLFPEIDSTSTYLLNRPRPAAGHWHVAIAERQTAGRGRGDKRWHSPAGGGLWLSAAYTFEEAAESLPALTLAIGAGVAGTLKRIGVDGIMLKWPNDLIAGGRKLGGILLDSASSPSGTTVVCGLGLNMKLQRGLEFELSPVDLDSLLAEMPPMDALAAAMIESFATTTGRYEAEGFAAFTADWSALDWLRGRRVVVEQQDERREGIAAGVAETGALIVEDGEVEHHVVSGTVRLAGAVEVVA